MLIVVDEEEGLLELEWKIGCVENIIESLKLFYCCIIFCMGDMGFGVWKIYDLEVWILS